MKLQKYKYKIYQNRCKDVITIIKVNGVKSK
jgi:hypothetical protein